ncbi:NADAR family protein [Priestia megaterium]
MSTPYNPKRYKQLGRQVKPFNKELWDKKCREVVYQGNYLKFTQNPKLGKELTATHGTTLVEASPFDAIWGIKLGPDNPDRFDRSKWRGKNWLGEVLTKLRIDLIGE